MSTDTISIRVDIDTQYGSWKIGAPIDSIFIECFYPLNICDEPLLAIGTGAVSEANAEKVLVLRKDAVKVLSKQLTQLILAEMCSKDSVNGYRLIERST